ncbi:response regulator [Ructibacterium gallinarum]|uniref:Stage 0 sporulation protein A homolog n=1 Tax=Ructibacterium gallinarum TaxID=2779355 RepID=A0A9D5LY85_9FIRM|nr:response regulator [Ructibacterium gallinarum]MBE5040186.1 response regulator [Ructibacterium gallinarum]
MYQVFVVDDEPSARLGLCEYFPWEKYGCRVAGEAEDGKQAWEKIREEKPDIVLTDVKMPNMDGLELAALISRELPDTKIIFISGYSDVRYLKEAFHVAAVDYIFKPINLKEVEKVIQKVTGSLGDRQKQKAMILQMETQLLQSMPFLKEKFFMALIRDSDFREEELKKKMEFLNVRFPSGNLYYILIVSVDSAAEVFGGRSERESQLLSFAVLNVVQELLEKYFIGYSFEDSRGEYVCIVCPRRGQEEQLLLLAEEIRENLAQFLELSTTVGIGSPAEELCELRHSYIKAARAVEQRLFMGQNRIIVTEDEDRPEQDWYQIDFRRPERLSDFLQNGDYGSAKKEIMDFFGEIGRHHEMPKWYIQSLCMNLLLLPDQLLYEYGGREAAKEQEIPQEIERFYKIETVREMERFIADRYQAVCSFFEGRRNSKQRALIRKIQEVIQERYAENLTINQIADEVYFSATYLSFLFKQETGETINDYITSVRMEKAKEMLSDPAIKSYEVCRAVGYQDAGYFSKLFKKYTGCSPSQYREKL